MAFISESSKKIAYDMPQSIRLLNKWKNIRNNRWGVGLVSDKKPGLQNKRETPTVKGNENLLTHRRRFPSCTYKYRSRERLRQPQISHRWNSRSNKPDSRPCARP